MAKLVVMPKLGLTMTEGLVSRWLKAEGDAVKEGEPLFEVETDKLTNTIEATASGTLLKILAKEGDTLPCLAGVAVIGEPNEDISELVPGEAPKAEAPAPAAAPAAPAAPAKAPGGRVVASPAAKKLAKELGLDIALVPGTGPGGRITEEDVKKFKAAPPPPPEPPKPAPEPGPKASPLAAKAAAELGMDLKDVPHKGGRILAADILAAVSAPAAEEGPREEVKRMNGMRKAIARNMQNSHMTSPTVTFNLGCDVTELAKLRARLKADDIKVSYTDILVKLVAVALREFPLLNCSVDGDNIIYKNYVNMGVAVALDNGLVVPNVRDADKKGLREISAEVKELANLARTGSLPMDRLSGGTFTITNLGMYGIESFSPIINQPEVAILGVNTIVEKPVVIDGEICVRPILNLSLTADHRVVDGSVAAQFLQRVKKLIECPALVLA